MSGKSIPPSSTTSQRNVPKIKRPATVTAATNARRPQLKINQATKNVKNVPLKPKGLPPLSTPATEGSQLPPRRQPIPPSVSDQLNDQYDLYLQSYLLKVMNQTLYGMTAQHCAEKLGNKVVEKIAQWPHQKKRFLNIVGVHLFTQLSYVEYIRDSFKNLLDFTGEETLVELQGVLMKKFDKVLVKGAEVSEPLFQNNEIENMSKALQTHLLESQEVSRVAGYCQAFASVLRKLHVLLKISRKDSIKQRNNYIMRLEDLSIFCSDKACKEKTANNAMGTFDMLLEYDFETIIQLALQNALNKGGRNTSDGSDDSDSD